MTDTTGPASRESVVGIPRERVLAGAAVLFGVATPFLNNMPIIDMTVVGTIAAYGLIACGLILVALGFPIIMARLATGEWLFIGLFLAAATLATLAGLLSGINPEPASLLKLVVLNLVLYLVAKLLVDSDTVDRYLRWFYYLCVFAAVQAIVATVAGFLGLRQIGLIDLSGGGDRYVLGWWGLLGGDNGNFRTNFYFSEPTYFAQMLIPATFFAYVTRRWVGSCILLVGLITTVALSAAVAFLVGFAFLILRRGLSLVSLGIMTAASMGTLLIVNFLAANPLLYVLLFERKNSVAKKIATAQFTVDHLSNYPFGIGPVDLPERYGAFVPVANGILDLGAHLGFPGLAIGAGIGLYLAYVATKLGTSRELVGVAIGLGSLMLSGVTHGPLLKYFAVFMLSALVLKSSWRVPPRATTP